MKKRISVILLIAMIMLLTVGCGIQNNFLKAMDSVQGNNFVEFNMSIEDIALSKEASDDISLNAVITQVKEMKIQGDVLTSGKDENSFKMNMNIKMLGNTIPFEIISEKDRVYLSANYITAITKLMGSSMGIGDMYSGLDDTLKGKYVDLAENTGIIDGSKDLEKNSKEIQDVAKKFLKELDKSKFSEKNGKITCKLNKEDVIKLMKDLDKYVSEIYPDYEEFDEKSLEAVDIFDLEITLDENGKTSDMLVKVGVNDEEEDIQTITLKIDMKHSTSKDKFTMPSKENIITSEEMDKIMEDFYTNSFGNFEFDEEEEVLEEDLGV